MKKDYAFLSSLDTCVFFVAPITKPQIPYPNEIHVTVLKYT